MKLTEICKRWIIQLKVRRIEKDIAESEMQMDGLLAEIADRQSQMNCPMISPISVCLVEDDLIILRSQYNAIDWHIGTQRIALSQLHVKLGVSA